MHVLNFSKLCVENCAVVRIHPPSPSGNRQNRSPIKARSDCQGWGLGAPYHVSPTRVERVSNHTLFILPLKLPHRKRGSSTILLTATGVQDHEDVLYIYAMYSLYHSIYTTTGCRGNRQPDLINQIFATLQRWTTKSGHFSSRIIDTSSSAWF